MQRMLAAVAATFGCVLGVGLAPALASPPGALDEPPGSELVLVVDDDLVQCPDAQFQSIQAAVAAAQPGARIVVCPGVYDESVTVPPTLPGLAIVADEGAQATGCREPGAPDPEHEAIVQPPAIAQWGVGLLADDTQLTGLRVRETNNGPGVYTSALTSGYLISENVVEDNVFGVYLNASGATASRVVDNCIRLNNRPGSASGNGVYTDQGLRDAVVADNGFHRNRSAAVVLVAVPSVSQTADVVVRDNTSHMDGSAVVLFDTEDVRVLDNEARQNAGSAIFLGTNNRGTRIAANDLAAGSASAIVFRTFGAPNLDVTVLDNEVRQFARSGIVSVENSLTGSRLDGNASLDNGRDGIALGSGSVGNSLEGNTALDNGTLDCRDDNAPGANAWIENTGRTASPDDICEDDD